MLGMKSRKDELLEELSEHLAYTEGEVARLRGKLEAVEGDRHRAETAMMEERGRAATFHAELAATNRELSRIQTEHDRLWGRLELAYDRLADAPRSLPMSLPPEEPEELPDADILENIEADMAPGRILKDPTEVDGVLWFDKPEEEEAVVDG